MAQATVFVDGAVLGHLPPVCAKTGVATHDRLVLSVPVGGSEGPGIAWLLVLVGPFGWVGLLVYAALRRVALLTVKLPYCDAAYKEMTQARRNRRTTGLAAMACFIMAVLAAFSPSEVAHVAAGALALVGIGLCITYAVETIRVRRAEVRVQLDGSRQWVTLSRISEGLAQAIMTSRADHPGSERERLPTP